MYQDFKIIGRQGTNIFYSLPSIGGVTDAVLDSLPWAADVSRVSMIFTEQVRDEYETVKRNISGKYSTRLVYYAAKRDLEAPEPVVGGEAIEKKLVTDISKIRKLYLDSVKKVFSGEWPDRISADRLKFSEKVAKERLTLRKSICLARNKEVVGVGTFVSLTDFLRGPVDCFNWVWLDKSLTSAERIKAKIIIVAWLKETAGELLNGYIDSFNWRSQRFARGIGFKPECLIIEKH